MEKNVPKHQPDNDMASLVSDLIYFRTDRAELFHGSPSSLWHPSVRASVEHILNLLKGPESSMFDKGLKHTGDLVYPQLIGNLHIYIYSIYIVSIWKRMRLVNIISSFNVEKNEMRGKHDQFPY